jgi:hypothetical protein
MIRGHFGIFWGCLRKYRGAKSNSQKKKTTKTSKMSWHQIKEVNGGGSIGAFLNLKHLFYLGLN